MPSFCTTSWQGPSLTVFGMRSRSRLIIGSILSASRMPPGIFGVMISSISCARSSSLLTPSAMQMRFVEPNRLTPTGISKPVGRSKSSPGPPPGDFDARSVTAAISRSGLTGSLIRASSRSLSRAAMKSFKSRNITRSPFSQQSASPARARAGRRRHRPRERGARGWRRRNPPARAAAARRARRESLRLRSSASCRHA